MASNIQPKQKKFSRRMVTIFWSAIVIVVLSTLLYYERIDVLYILATIGLVALLLIVAFANLEGIDTEVES